MDHNFRSNNDFYFDMPKNPNGNKQNGIPKDAHADSEGARCEGTE